MEAAATGARVAAAAALAVGFSLSGLPVAFADPPDGGDTHSASAEAPAGSARPPRQVRVPRPTDQPTAPIRRVPGASSARPAAAQVALPNRPRPRQRPAAAPPAAAPAAAHDAPTPPPAVANDTTAQPLPRNAAAVTATPPPALPAPEPFDAAVPQWVSARDAAPPAPAAAPPQDVRGVATAVQGLLDSAGTLLANLPVTPFTDFMSGALWLTRRALVPVGSGLGSPAACGAKCTSKTVSGQVLAVTSAVDGQAGSLRDVLSQAASGDVIRFAPKLRHATLNLTQGELDVNVSVRIEGTQQTLDAGGGSRIMRLDEPGT